MTGHQLRHDSLTKSVIKVDVESHYRKGKTKDGVHETNHGRH